jgi:hypothetical protein
MSVEKICRRAIRIHPGLDRRPGFSYVLAWRFRLTHV